MPNPSKSKLLARLRIARRVILGWIATADKDTLRIIAGELGQWRKAISVKIKE